MNYRKIIKFGNSSHVISLPSTWLEKNKLGKGDVIYFTENGGSELIIAPTLKEKKREEIISSINAEGLDLQELSRRIVSSYIGGSSTITVFGNNKLIDKYGDEIRQLLSSLTALEVVEHTRERIVAKDLLDPSQFSLDNSIRRVDIILRSMMYDVQNRSEHSQILRKRDADINRITYLSLRMIKMQLRNCDSYNLMGNPVKLLAAWELLVNIEHLADEIKRISGCLEKSTSSPKIIKEFLSYFEVLIKEYENVMKCYFTKNAARAFESAKVKRNIIKMCTAMSSKNMDIHMGNAIEKLKSGAVNIRNLARSVYDLS